MYLLYSNVLITSARPSCAITVFSRKLKKLKDKN